MKQKSSFEKNGGTYRIVNGYKIPNVKLTDEATSPLGKWGQLHKDYLLRYKPTVLTIMLSEGTLWEYLQNFDRQAQEMFDLLVKQICEEENITEELKEKDQLYWVRLMNSVYNRSTEIVNHELIYK